MRSPILRLVSFFSSRSAFQRSNKTVIVGCLLMRMLRNAGLLYLIRVRSLLGYPAHFGHGWRCGWYGQELVNCTDNGCSREFGAPILRIDPHPNTFTRR